MSSYIDELNNAAAKANEASERANAASLLIHEVANGSDTETVPTANGEVLTVAHAIRQVREDIAAGAVAPISEQTQIFETGQQSILFQKLNTNGIAIYVQGGDGGFNRYFNFAVTGSNTIVLADEFAEGTVIMGVAQEIGGDVTTAVQQTQANADLAGEWAVKMDGPVEGSEHSAKFHATNAAASDAAALSSKNAAASSASAALASQNAAASSEANAASSEANAASSENAAASSASAALASENAAASSEQSALEYLQSFRGIYYGELEVDPVLDPNGNPPTLGDKYFNSTTNNERTFNGEAWLGNDILGHVNDADPHSQYLMKEENLGDLGDVATARANLGLKSAALRDAQSDLYDTTHGRTLEVGSFGIGAAGGLANNYATEDGVESNDFNKFVVPGRYHTNGEYLNGPDSDTTSGVLDIEGRPFSASKAVQTFTSIAGEVYKRTVSGSGSPTEWRRVFDTGNQLDIGTSASSARSALNLGSSATANTTDSRTNSSTTTVLQAKAMDDHRNSGDHDNRYWIIDEEIYTKGSINYRDVGSGSWARGLNQRDESGNVLAGVGIHGNGNLNTGAYLGIGSGPWTSNNNGVRVNSSGVNVTGTLSGNGSGLTSLNASNLSSGTVPSARISSTASRTSTSTTSLLQAKAMDDHRNSGDHDSRYPTTSATNLGATSNTSLRTIASAAEWAALPVGFCGFLRGNDSGSVGAPIGSLGYFIKTANRDTAGGWSGIWVGYAANQHYFGRASGSTVLPTWEQVLVSGGSGSGSGLTSLNASNLSSGTVADARLPSTAVRTSRNITAGTHLSGGGNLSADRTLTLTPATNTWITDNQGNQRLYFGNTSATTSNLILRLSNTSGSFEFRDSASTARFRIDTNGQVTLGNVPWARLSGHPTVTAGNGLSGGGDLSASRTVTLGTPSSITATSTNSVTATSHTHAISEGTIRTLIAAGTAGAVGTYTLAYRASTTTAAHNSTYAGSNLRATCADGITRTPTLAGTWRTMGASNMSDNDRRRVTVFLRIS